MAEFKRILISDIVIPERLRAVEEEHAIAIAQSIVEHGLINPITVRSTPNAKGGKYTLVAGAHRIRAEQINDVPEIDAMIVEGDKAEAQLIEITENLFRNDLSVMDRAIFVQSYRDIWEKAHGKIAAGRPGNRANLAQLFGDETEAGSFSQHVADRMACNKGGVEKSALYEWRRMVEGIDRQDWLAALAPNYTNERSRSECHPKAWEYLTSDYLRAEAPKFSTCYRRLIKVAEKQGWSPIPHERSLRRRLDAEVSAAVQHLARKGKEKSKGLYPAQRRTRSHLHAMQMVNMDGHKLDVFVSVPWSEQPVRMFLLGIQDLYSGKIVAWRISDSENKETVRLVIGDMVERFGIPDRIYLDNGRSFASKWISGGAATRYRFKVREEDPEGLLVTLGIEPRWTNPYSGQSKPIERAWGDAPTITDEIELPQEDAP